MIPRAYVVRLRPFEHVTATILDTMGIAAPEGLVGTPWRLEARRPGSAGAIHHLVRQSAAPEMLRPLVHDFSHWFMIGQLSAVVTLSLAAAVLDGWTGWGRLTVCVQAMRPQKATSATLNLDLGESRRHVAEASLTS